MKQYIYDLSLLAAAVLPALVSLAVDLQYPNGYYWLQRSGSIMVLCGIVLDVRQYWFSKTEESSDFTVNGKPAIIGKVVPEPRKRLQRIAVALAVIGTVIWGYGDVPFRVI